MSKGPGKVERAIAAAMKAEPDNAFTVEDLCDRVYPGLNRVEKKNRVSVIRAMRNLVARGGSLDYCPSGARGGTLILFDRCSLMSYAMARMKASSWERYRPAQQTAGKWIGAHEMSKLPPAEQEQAIRAKLAPGGKEHHLVAVGGTWWDHCEMHRARRDGRTERAEELHAKHEAEFAEWRAIAEAMKRSR